jgi:hypothetical protein
MFGLLAAGYYAAVSGGFTGRFLAAPTPEAAAILQPLGEARTQMILSHVAAEQSRFFLARFEEAEVVLGLILTAALLFATHAHRLATVLSGAMTVITLFLRLFIGPELAHIGRALDFSVVPVSSPQAGALWTLRMTYSALAILKVVMGAALTWYLLTFKTSLRPHSRVGDPRSTRAED